LIAVGLFAGALLAGFWDASAQQTAANAALGVNEAAARATLTKDTIELRLPLNVPAAAGVRAVAWTLSPTGKASAEASVDLREGSRDANLSLAWPIDDHGHPADRIGWYRIGYRIESGGIVLTKGILAVGAIAADLMELRLAAPVNLVTGVPLAVRVYAGNPITRQPFRGVHLKARLVIDADATGKDAKGKTEASKQTIAKEAVTDRSGEATFNFPYPTLPGQTATLTVDGTLTGPVGAETSRELVTASVARDFESGDHTTIRVETDKPLHKPGETVHLRALVFNDAGHAAANTGLTLTINDPEYKKLLEIPLKTNRFGIASYDWKTGPQLAPGDYNAQFEIDDSSDYKGSADLTLRIQRYELPEFTVRATMDHGYYLEGQTPAVRIHAGYLFGKPVAAGSVKIARADQGKWNPKTGKYDEPDKPEQPGTLDLNGDAELHLDVKDDFDDLKSHDYERYSDLQYRAVVTDASTGRSEPRNFTVRLTKEPVHIYLDKVGGNEREGDFIVTTTYADGVPAACQVTLDWMDGDSHPTKAAAVTTSMFGLARVHLRYPAFAPGKNQLDLRVTALDREGRRSKFDDTINPHPPNDLWISVAHTLLKPGEAIEAVVHGEAGSFVDLDVLGGTGLLLHQRLHMSRAAEPVTIPATSGFHGLVTLCAYTMTAEMPQYHWQWDGEAGYKSVLYPEDLELKLKLTGLQPSYSPGATVDAGLTVQNAAKSAAPSALGVAVIDTAVEQRAATEEEANEHWYGWNWWQSNDSAGGITREMLDRMDMSKPIPDDLDLAAEKLLMGTQAARIQIDAESDDLVRSDYQQTMSHSLVELGKAVLAARPAHLPDTFEGVRAIAAWAKLGDQLLLDPWNTPYKPERNDQYNEEVLNLRSAGPDKRFGTEDDFTIPVTQRNLFALPGEQLAKLLADASRAEQPLPATIDGLKEFARNGGLDLDSAVDSTLDSEGKPWVYSINVRRRFYWVQVANQLKWGIWTGPYIDYFGPTEARMEAAIRAWTESGKPFPETEPEARQAFKAASIDFDLLRDPLGKPFQLISTQVTTYTRVEKVKAGAKLDANSKPVTHLLRAIQVMRTNDPSPGESAPGNHEMVAQFLHPISEQSGSDKVPQAVDQGTFKGNTGAIGGTVTDQTGAVIPSAVVTVGTGEDPALASATTDAAGYYLISSLAPGNYQVKVVAKGFESFWLTEVRVSAVALTSIDVKLTVGTETQTVTVEADALAVQTDSNAVSTLVSSAQISQIATENRNFAALAALGLGVSSALKDGAHGNGKGSATISEPTFTPRLRHVFEETAFWAPSLETSASGRASLHFALPDSLTTWKLHALASTVDGRIGVLDQTFKTFQPFFVDLDAPQVLTMGDEITLPVNLRNYTDHALALPVTAKPAAWFTLFTPAAVEASVPSNGTTPVIFGFRAGRSVEAGPLNITAANAHEGDAVEKTVRVHPDGEPRAVTASGLLRSGSTTLALDLPADTIAGSVHAELLLYPNLGAHLLHSMKAVLERPYGCGEQTISSTYPSLLFLELLQAAKATSPVQAEAQTYLQLGYDRLAGYFAPGGGLTYWGGEDHDPDPALTAYGIEFLTEAEPFVTVDRSRIVDSVSWLLRNQLADGSWKPHYGDTEAGLDLYVAEVLARTLANEYFTKNAPKDLRDRAARAVERAEAWAAHSVAAVHDPYANALRLRLAGNDAEKARLRAELAQTALRGQDGAHWSRAGYSPFYGWGHAGELETTAWVLAALGQMDAKAPAADRELADGALYYLLRGQDRYGIWLSGQATVRVLQALLPLAIAQMTQTNTATAPDFRLAVNRVPLSDKDAEALHADPRLLDAPRSLDLTAMLKPGHNELTFTSAGDSALASAEASAGYYIPWTEEAKQAQTKTKTGNDYGLDFGYQCAAADARVGRPIDCNVDLRRFGSSSYGMLLAEVGLPPGADVDRASLARLLDHWTVSRYELQPDRIVFYIWPWRAEGTHFSFSFTPRYAIHAKAAPATLSDYYNPDFKAVLAPQEFSVK
jgi:uncharacterized protein YfaS (alpha-2-macroglobulin family)